MSPSREEGWNAGNHTGRLIQAETFRQERRNRPTHGWDTSRALQGCTVGLALLGIRERRCRNFQCRGDGNRESLRVRLIECVYDRYDEI